MVEISTYTLENIAMELKKISPNFANNVFENPLPYIVGLVEKADTSILVEKGHTSGLSLNYYYLSWDPLTLDNHLARSVYFIYMYFLISFLQLYISQTDLF